jgi:16S rRNA processing protein RimM
VRTCSSTSSIERPPEALAADAMTDTPARVSAGRVGRPHGLDGSFHVTQPVARLLEPGAAVSVAGESREIVRRAGTPERPIVRLRGLAARADAEALRGADLLVEAKEAPALPEGEWWAHELEGCEVYDGEQLVGTVLALLELPSCEALEVRATGARQPLLVPLVKDAVRAVDVAARRIDVDLEFLGLAGGAP